MLVVRAMDITRRYDEALAALLPDVIAHRASWSAELALRTRLHGERPALFSPERASTLYSTAELVQARLLDVPRRVFGDDLEKVARFLGEPILATPWFVAQYPKAHEQVLARPDAVFDGRSYRIIDANVSSGIGCYDRTEVAGAYFRAHPVVRALGPELGARFDSVYDAIAAEVGIDRRLGAKLFYYDVPRSLPKHHRWSSKLVIEDFRRRGIDAEIVDDARLPAAMRSASRERIVIVRAFAPQVMHRQARLYRNFRALALAPERRGRSVRILNNPWETAFFNKLFLACLSDPRMLDGVSAAMRKRLAAAVPWTRVLTADLVELAIRERHRFVLKKGNSFSSLHVRFGLATPPATWARAVRRAVGGGGWILQEVVRGVWEETPVIVEGKLVRARALTVDSPFLVGRRRAGILRRERFARQPAHPGLPLREGSTIGVRCGF